MIKAYNRVPPIFIAPHTVHSPDERSFRAWIIPARGSLPWNEASSSMVLDPTGSQVLAINATESMIQWSHAALVSFWKYLIQLKNLNTFGPLSLSFHPSKTSLLLKKEKSRAPSHAADVSVSISQSSLGARSSTLGTQSSTLGTQSSTLGTQSSSWARNRARWARNRARYPLAHCREIWTTSNCIMMLKFRCIYGVH
ncbi:hypothetical protein BT96DRAFT_1024746 [Gymnopus androsaceus JB14]|uniref:Uncharacterized protein n=1 Tax=Gymnopus androsaceus JB14 TaxID=1447944 RepID=A0A6A4GW35_9AGAR|nr:hypothetical protein BT96DRAFT_1024746 [Gymnopus androsaceus JB14]